MLPRLCVDYVISCMLGAREKNVIQRMRARVPALFSLNSSFHVTTAAGYIIIICFFKNIYVRGVIQFRARGGQTAVSHVVSIF